MEYRPVVGGRFNCNLMSLVDPSGHTRRGCFGEVGDDTSVYEARRGEEVSDRLDIAVVCKLCPALFRHMVTLSSAGCVGSYAKFRQHSSKAMQSSSVGFSSEGTWDRSGPAPIPDQVAHCEGRDVPCARQEGAARRRSVGTARGPRAHESRASASPKTKARAWSKARARTKPRRRFRSPATGAGKEFETMHETAERLQEAGRRGRVDGLEPDRQGLHSELARYR